MAMQTLITAGRLISATDIKVARKLGQVIDVADITGGATPEWLKQTKNCLQFQFNGDFFELVRA